MPVGVALLEQLLRQSVGTRKAPGYQVAHYPLAVTMPSSLSAPAGPCPSPRRAAGPAPALLGFGLGHVGLRSGSGMLLGLNPRPLERDRGSLRLPRMCRRAVSPLSIRSMWQPDGQGRALQLATATGAGMPLARPGDPGIEERAHCIFRPGQGPGTRPPNAGLHIGTGARPAARPDSASPASGPHELSGLICHM